MREEQQKLEKENRQVGKGDPPAGLLVFLHGTWFPAVDCLISMLLMEPTGSGKRQGSGVEDCLERAVLGGQAREVTDFTCRDS